MSIPWYEKYLKKINCIAIERFYKSERIYDIDKIIVGGWSKDFSMALLLCACILKKDKAITWLNSIADGLNLPLIILLHKIVQPKCKDCIYCDLEEDRYLENCIYHQISAFDDEISYIVLPSRNKAIDAPPLGCDCWEPRSGLNDMKIERI